MTGDNGWKTCDCPGPTDNEITLEWLADNSILIFIKCYIQKLIKLSPFLYLYLKAFPRLFKPLPKENTRSGCMRGCVQMFVTSVLCVSAN